MNKICLLLFVLTTYTVTDCVTEEYGTCDQTFHIFKNTQATSDSERECKNAYAIFPYIYDEGANKFHDGECAYQCKLQLPDTCFSIHAPQTMEHDEGLLSVHILERKMTQKWKYVLDDNHDIYQYNYDAFFDFNMGFYVQSLDDYILHWNKYNDETVSVELNDKLEYIGIEWNLENYKFYSLLIHSPYSAINYEFMSQNKPSDNLYENIKWIQSNIPRCTFKAMNNPYPWNRNDHALIVPVRISHAVTNIASIYEFYVHVMGANVLYNSYQHTVDIDSEAAETLSVALLNTQIELQFIYRPSHYTYGDFTLELYEHLLMETHASIISSTYCGIDRWFDNHFGYSAYSINGYMDNMIINLNNNNMIYRLYKLSYEHSSVVMKKELEYYGYSTQYGAIVIDPTGQTIEVNGYISDPQIQRLSPVANPQWCSNPCTGNMVQGSVDPSHIYIDIVDDINLGDDINIIQKEKHKNHMPMSTIYIIIVISAVIFAVSCMLCIAYYCCCRNICWIRSPPIYSSNTVSIYKRTDTTPLMIDVPDIY